jgi:hypothetical protein
MLQLHITLIALLALATLVAAAAFIKNATLKKKSKESSQWLTQEKQKTGRLEELLARCTALIDQSSLSLTQEKSTRKELEQKLAQYEALIDQSSAALEKEKLISGELEKQLAKYTALIDREALLVKLNAQAFAKASEIQAIEAQAKVSARERRKQADELTAEIALLKQELSTLQEISFLEEFGYYEYKYTFETSGRYADALDRVRDFQKAMLKEKKAAVCPTGWRVGDSRKEGERMVNGFLKMMLRAFNGECDACISRVKYNNATTMRNRIESSFKAVNELGKAINCRITHEYHQLKIEELELTYEHQSKKQEEQEEQRRIREQMRDEERALKDAEKARTEAEKEERRYQKALEDARLELHTAAAGQRQKLEEEIAALTLRLQEAEREKQRAQSMAELTKCGHIYIISNVGSFGNNVYKIGMTRRLDPMDRVIELGDASVPFPFDVHAMIYTTNAPALESMLHKKFHARRMNAINERKEFFRISIDEIETALEEAVQVNSQLKFKMQLTKIAEAKQYRQTLARQRQLSAV